MNDYKELIEKLRMAGRWIKHDDGSEETYLLSVNDCVEIADAIEQLVKERDELKSKIFDSKPCLCCRHTTKSVMLEPCASCNSNHDNWEWRGVSE